MTIRSLSLPLLCFLLLLAGCNNDDTNTDPCANDFDQTGLFIHLADEVILPLYGDLQIKVSDLQQKTDNFSDNPNTTTLAILRTSWKTAYLAWERCEPFEFGPAADVFLRNSLNNFPVNAPAIDQNIQSGSYNFDNPEAYDKGFPALDYLLFGIGADDAAIVAKYTADPLAANYRQYLLDLVTDIAERVTQTQDGWVSGYRDVFVQNTGTAAGSSLSLVVNNLNEHYENIKRDRLGIPSGVLTLGFTNPDKTEAYYSGISAELALEAVTWSRRFYRGTNFTGGENTGLDDFLNYIDATKNGKPLDVVIQEQYQAAIQAVSAITDPLSEAVDQDSETVIAAYNELTKQVVNLKTDMPTALCVSITYIDNPSDSD